MTVPDWQVIVYFDFAYTPTAFTLDDTTRGELDSTTYKLYESSPVDVTSDVNSVSVRRGNNSQLFPDINAGTAVIQLNNESRVYDPEYTDSPYFGNIIPGRRVTVYANGLPVIDGRVSDWSYTYDVSGRSVAVMSVVDGLGILARQEMDAWTATASQLTGARISAVLDRSDVQWPYARDIDDGVSTLTDDDVAFGTNVLQYLNTVAKSDLGLIYCGRDGVFNFRDRHAALNAAGEVAIGEVCNYLLLPGTAGAYATVPDSAALDLTGTLSITARVAPDDWSPSNQYRIFSKLNGASVAAGGGYEFYISSLGALAFQYSNGTTNSLLASDFLALADGTAYWVKVEFDSGTSVATFSYATDDDDEPTSWNPAGTSSAGTGSPSANTIDGYIGGISGLSREFAGKMYRVIVRNSSDTIVLDADFTQGITSPATTSFTEYTSNAATVTIAGGTPVYDVATIPFQEVGITTGADTFYTRATITREGGTAQSYSSAAASSDGIVTLTINGLLLDSDSQALDMATFYASVYSNGDARVSQVGVVLDSTLMSGSDLQALLNVELNDVVAINWTPNGIAPALEQRAVVLGIQHDAVPGEHRLRLTLGRYDDRAPFILDSSSSGVLDGAPVLAF